MTIPSWLYRDPSYVAEVREKKSCHGCVHRDELWGVDYCGKGKWSGTNNEKRCDDWESACAKP